MLAALALALPGARAGAGVLTAPAGEVVLTIRGAVAMTNGQGEARFDMAMLQAMPRLDFTTSTVWTEGRSTYSGVLLRDLLRALGVEGGRIVASAIDGYQVTIPFEDLHDDGPILAYWRDGSVMPVRERGPLWLLFPFDDNPAYRNDTSYGRSIWQLTQIEIRD